MEASSGTLTFDPLRIEHLTELAELLRDEEVYRHIEPALPSREEIIEDLSRALRHSGSAIENPPSVHYLIREIPSGAMVGRLEANLHDGLCEVAFLLGRKWWGRGFGSVSLKWLHATMRAEFGIRLFYATVTPANVRSQRLLSRNGYTEMRSGWPRLLSYESGDLVFRRSAENEVKNPDGTKIEVTTDDVARFQNTRLPPG